MRTLLKLTLGLMIGGVILTSCDDDNDDVQAITQQRLQHKWGVDSITIRTVTGPTDISITQPGTTDDYVDFRSDGKVYSKLGPDAPDTSAYTLLNDTQIKIDTDTATIETLTSTRFIATVRTQTNVSNYSIVKSYLRR